MVRSEFVALVPVKPPAHGKSRLAAFGDEQRSLLARAFVLDTLDAVSTATRVAACIVVTDDHRLAATLSDEMPGPMVVIPDGVSGDLNESLRLAAAEARRRWPRLRPVALCADLPALTPQALDETLARVEEMAARQPAFVADLAGTGTTLYTAPDALFAPRFGPESARRHREAGAVPLTEVPDVVRMDVDDVADLSRALVTGVGPRTARASGRS